MKKTRLHKFSVIGTTILFVILTIITTLSQSGAQQFNNQILASDYITKNIIIENNDEQQEIDTDVNLILRKSQSNDYFKTRLASNDVTDVECLAFALYGEARGESYTGMIAVAFVVHERVKKFEQSYCSIIKDKTQFLFKVSKPRNIADRNAWEKIVNLSHYLIIIDGFSKIKSPTDGALFFNSIDVPHFNRKLIKVIGRHRFYK